MFKNMSRHFIFGSTSQNLCDDFAKIMHDKFEMSMMGELNFFLGLQIKQMKDGIFFNQSKYIKEMLKKFGLEDSKPTKTPMSLEIKLTKDDEADSRIALKNPKTTHLEAVKRIFRDYKSSPMDWNTLQDLLGFFKLLRIRLGGKSIPTTEWSRYGVSVEVDTAYRAVSLECGQRLAIFTMKNDIGYGASDFHRRSSSNKAAETCIHGRNDGMDIHARTHPHSSRS
ncbi:copia protein [Tanacetum coccineum]